MKEKRERAGTSVRIGEGALTAEHEAEARLVRGAAVVERQAKRLQVGLGVQGINSPGSPMLLELHGLFGLGVGGRGADGIRGGGNGRGVGGSGDGSVAGIGVSGGERGRHGAIFPSGKLCGWTRAS